MFSLLGELVPVFWLLELDLVSLKGSSVFSSRFWRVQYGFSMPLSSPSSFSGVGGVYIQSGFKVALSAYLQCHQPLPVPGITASATVPLSCPALLVKTY